MRLEHTQKIRYSLGTLETASLLKCIRYVASHKHLALCGSARMYLDSSFSIESRANIFYWLENDAPIGWLDWISDTENFCKAVWTM